MSFAEELAKLSNPVPSFDPEDDITEETRATLVDKTALDADNIISSSISRLRKLHDDDDPKYDGKIMSRKDLEDEKIIHEDFGNDYESDSALSSNEDNSDTNNEQMFDEEINSDDAMGESDEENEQFAPSLFKKSKTGTTSLISKETATKNQIKLWETMLEMRIRLQKLMTAVNQLPQPETYTTFADMGGRDLTATTQTASNSVLNLKTTLVELQLLLLKQNKDTSGLIKGKTKCDSDDVKETVKSHRNKTLNYWYDKTRLSSSNINNKSFSTFERPTVAQIEHILMDRTRLLERTQLRRSKYRVLGCNDKMEENGKTEEVVHNAHLKHIDKEIFDDDDFYQQLLRQFIEQKASVSSNTTDSVEMTRQWLKLQRLRTKFKKVVDTKASKGRKVRYHIHPKLVSFMTPRDQSSWTHESRNQLVKSIFGQASHIAKHTDI